jgi:Arc/MetJ-type ribon-helix-helix transcriptional regulator
MAEERGNAAAISVKIPRALLEGLNKLVEAGLYHNRSEAIRVAIRDILRRELGEEFYRIVNGRRRGEEVTGSDD